ncbi:hypothetical protein RND81_07G160000 [Saponaria officinalis]|uniref:X8 domain-containing protein n=1 Tax=Saponaria officinalis TaxID=3572 RepID=A0AAW1JRH4_SAPOF
MDASILRCLSFLLLLGIISGSSAEVITRMQRYGDTLDAPIHDTYPTIVGNPTGDVPTLDPSPSTPTTTPTTSPMTPMTGPPTMPTTGPPSIPTTTPTPPYGGGGAGAGDGGGGAGGGAGAGGGGGGGGIGGGGGGGVGAGGGGGVGGGGGGGSWCVANPSASEKALQVGLDYACGYGGADCSQIQPGASCYNPDTIRDHASYAYNNYYQKNPSPTSCDFGGTAQLVSTDPSSGSCHFPSKGSTSPTPPSPTPPMQTPPTMMSPPSMFMPGTPLGGSSVFGPEPTASPNTATTTSRQLLLFLSSTSVLMYILLANPA